MEELLNKLIEKGRNVFGHKDRINAEKCKYSEGIFYEFENHNMSISLRELVSKESGLWQFVCENKLIEMKYSDWAKNPCIVGEYPTLDCDIHYGWDDYHHWLMESSLKDESELEQFLIDNIKVEGK